MRRRSGRRRVAGLLVRDREPDQARPKRHRLSIFGPSLEIFRHSFLGKLFLECRIELGAFPREAAPLNAVQFVAQSLLNRAAAVSKFLLADQTIEPREQMLIDRNGNFRAGHASPRGMIKYHTP